MAVTINGTTGVSGVDGSAATPALIGSDPNTGIFFPAADTIAFSEGGVESMRIDSSGNVGIGTTAPLSKLHVNTGAAGYGITVAASAQTSNEFQLGIDSSSNFAIYDTTAAANRMVISNAGNVGIGTSSPSTYGNLAILGKTYSLTGYALTTDPSNFTPAGVTNSIPNYGLGAPEVSVVSLSGFESLRFYANQIERLRVAQLGQIGIGGANYGTSGQVLTSGGSGAAPSWTSTGFASAVVSSKIAVRATATTYQNTTNGWLLVSVSMSNNGQTFLIGPTNAVAITGISMNVAGSNMTYMVPPLWYYRVTGTVISVWTEGQA